MKVNCPRRATNSIAGRCDFRGWRYIRKYLGSSSIEAKGSGTIARFLLNRQGLKCVMPCSVFQFFQFSDFGLLYGAKVRFRVEYFEGR